MSSKYEQFKETLPLLKELVNAQTFGKKFSVKIFSGASGILKAYYRLLDLPKGERIFYFEGLEAVKIKMSMRDQSLIKWQEQFRQSGIIIEVLGTRKSIQEVKKRKGVNVLEAHRKRLLVTYELPDAINDFPCDIAVLPNTVIFFIVKLEQAVVIDSSDLAKTFKQLFSGLKMVSTKNDSNQEVEDLLKLSN